MPYEGSPQPEDKVRQDLTILQADISRVLSGAAQGFNFNFPGLAPGASEGHIRYINASDAAELQDLLQEAFSAEYPDLFPTATVADTLAPTAV